MTRRGNLGEHILACSKKLADENGLSALNMRAVAAEAGVSLGTVYNYYPSKGDIIAAIVEDFWKTVFSDEAGIAGKTQPYATFIEETERGYKQISLYLNGFKANYLQELSMLPANEKKVAKAMENEYLLKINAEITRMLEKDARVRVRYTNDEIKLLADFIYENAVSMLQKGADFAFFKKILLKILN